MATLSPTHTPWSPWWSSHWPIAIALCSVFCFIEIQQGSGLPSLSSERTEKGEGGGRRVVITHLDMHTAIHSVSRYTNNIVLLSTWLVVIWGLIKLFHSSEKSLTGRLGWRKEDIPRVEWSITMLKQLQRSQKNTFVNERATADKD